MISSSWFKHWVPFGVWGSTWFSVFSSTDWPSSDCTSVFTGLCSLVGGWPGSESGSCMKNSWSLLLRLHLSSRSQRTSGSGSGGGLKIASDRFISVSSGSCFTAGDRVCEARWPRFVHTWLLIWPVAGIGKIHKSAFQVGYNVFRSGPFKKCLSFCMLLKCLRNQIVQLTKSDWRDWTDLCNVLLKWTALCLSL